MNESNPAVFLSCAAPDREATRQLAASLRKEGVEVWFEETVRPRRGGECAEKVKARIDACTLFVPIVSAQSEAEADGAFQIEWQAAAHRAEAAKTVRPFLVPIVIDATEMSAARVPKVFRSAHCIRLPGAEGAWGLGGRLQRLMGAQGTPESRWQQHMAGVRPAAVPPRTSDASRPTAKPGVISVEPADNSDHSSTSRRPSWACRGLAAAAGLRTWVTRWLVSHRSPRIKTNYGR